MEDELKTLLRGRFFSRPFHSHNSKSFHLDAILIWINSMKSDAKPSKFTSPSGDGGGSDIDVAVVGAAQNQSHFYDTGCSTLSTVIIWQYLVSRFEPRTRQTPPLPTSSFPLLPSRKWRHIVSMNTPASGSCVQCGSVQNGQRVGDDDVNGRRPLSLSKA